LARQTNWTARNPGPSAAPAEAARTVRDRPKQVFDCISTAYDVGAGSEADKMGKKCQILVKDMEFIGSILLLEQAFRQTRKDEVLFNNKLL
jgi:hypothetical protein